MITLLDFSNPPSSADDTDKMDFSDSLLHSSYTKNHLAFLDPSPNESMKNNQISSEENRSVIDDVNLITHVNVWTQAFNPIISLTIVFPILTIFASCAIFIQIRTMQMLSQENSVNNSIMVTQARIHIIFWPCMIIMNLATDSIYPLADIFTPLSCTVFSFYFWFCSFSMILYSFYAALLRYLCCVHTEWVNGFGMRKLIIIIYWSFYVHTIVWALYNILTSFELDHIPLVNKCYGYDERIFLMETSRLKALQRHICAIGFDGGKRLQFFNINNAYSSLKDYNDNNGYFH